MQDRDAGHSVEQGVGHASLTGRWTLDAPGYLRKDLPLEAQLRFLSSQRPFTAFPFRG